MENKNMIYQKSAYCALAQVLSNLDELMLTDSPITILSKLSGLIIDGTAQVCEAYEDEFPDNIMMLALENARLIGEVFTSKGWECKQ